VQEGLDIVVRYGEYVAASDIGETSMPHAEDLERLFRQLHQESVEHFDERTKRLRDDQERHAQAAAARQERELPRIAQLLGVPVEAITHPKFDNEAAHNEQLSERRQILVGRASQQATDAKRFSQHLPLSLPGARTVPIYASSVMAAAPEYIADIPGERGNPWVLPWNPGHITIKRSLLDIDYGICGWARLFDPLSAPLTVEVWFAFLADITTMWHLMVFTNFHGFYLLNATRGFLLCRDSRVTLNASLNVYQDSWLGEQSISLLNEESDTGFRDGIYDAFQRFDYSAPLRSSPQSYVIARLRITIQGFAYHGYAEINFADGAANYIEPLVLIAWPL
jgi:hypothetical protein